MDAADDHLVRAHFDKEPTHDESGTLSVADPPGLLPREGGVWMRRG